MQWLYVCEVYHIWYEETNLGTARQRSPVFHWVPPDILARHIPEAYISGSESGCLLHMWHHTHPRPPNWSNNHPL